MTRRFCMELLRLAAFMGTLFAVSAWAGSQARNVRLSDVQGRVQIDQATGQGYERAVLNLPIHQGTKLKTTANSRAEVEFEDGSAIHLAPDTIVQFTDLSLRDSGAKVSTIELQQGEAEFNFRGRKDNEFTVRFGQQAATPTNPAHFRLNLGNGTVSLEVFNGKVLVEGPGEVKITKGRRIPTTTPDAKASSTH